jgi:hypothetical protein
MGGHEGITGMKSGFAGRSMLVLPTADGWWLRGSGEKTFRPVRHPEQ